MPYPKTSNLRFFMNQIGYIQKRYWILSILLLLVLVFQPFHRTDVETELYLLSSIIPFFALLSIVEIQKSGAFHMEELEMSCKHNLAQITLIRITVIGTFDAAILIILTILSAQSSMDSFWNTNVFLIIPYLLSAYLSLLIVNRVQSRNVMYYCGMTTVGVSAMYLLQSIWRFMNDLEHILFFRWGVVLLLAGLIGYELYRLRNRMEELQWNLSLID